MAEQVSFEVKDGEFNIAIVGPSGCAVYVAIYRGSYSMIWMVALTLFDGIEVAKFNERKQSRLRKHNIGFVFQVLTLSMIECIWKCQVAFDLYRRQNQMSANAESKQFWKTKMRIMHRRNHAPPSNCRAVQLGSVWRWPAVSQITPN